MSIELECGVLAQKAVLVSSFYFQQTFCQNIPFLVRILRTRNDQGNGQGANRAINCFNTKYI